ncbi:hypothetical protein TYRP_002129 [Tyrophagus putrescentiae]|nr:hypothetical protein TYRP_002129 [Tyrophagus putrescentiae]
MVVVVAAVQQAQVEIFIVFIGVSMNPVETSLSRKSFRSVSSESRMPIALRRPRSPDSTAIRMFRRCSRSLRIR